MNEAAKVPIYARNTSDFGEKERKGFGYQLSGVKLDATTDN